MDRRAVVQGVTVPRFFYGTAWKEERSEGLTRLAVGAGFTAIDTANQRKHYFEAGVGAAIRSASRSSLFLQTKFTFARGQDRRIPYDPKAPFAEQVASSFASSLEHLGTTWIDSYVLHGPWSGEGIARADHEVWRAMEGLHDAGKVKLLGVSNVSLEQLEALHAFARVKPAFVQNRCYARSGWGSGVRAFCRDHGAAYQGFSLLTANGRELAGKTIDGIARKTGRTRAQVVFRFALQVGMIPLTGTSSADHMREDLASFDFELDAADVRAIEDVG